MSGPDAGGLGQGRRILPLSLLGSDWGRADSRESTALCPLTAALPDFTPGGRPVGFPWGTLRFGCLLPPMGNGAGAGLALTSTPLGFSLPALALTLVSHSTSRFKPDLTFQRAAE